MQFNYRGIFGPDLSFYQGNPSNNLFVDFEKMKAYGNQFAIIKAGQRNYADPAFGYNWTAARVAGLLRGAYWFLDDERDGKFQAEFFWSLLESDPPEGPMVVDYEWGSGTDWKRVYDFLARLLELSARPSHKLWIYTGYYYWRDYGPKTQNERQWFAQFPLWLAAYLSQIELNKVISGEIVPDGEDVRIPLPWTEMTMWQIGTPVLGLAMGVHSLEIDYNLFSGGIVELARYFDLNAGDYVPPNEGGNSMKYKVIWGQGASVRSKPTVVGNSPIAVLSNGTIISDVVEDNIPDQSDPTNVNKKWIKTASNTYVASAFPDSIGIVRIRLEKIEEPTPAPENRAYSFKVEGYKEVSGYLEPE